jgi:hypothetical protein
MKDKETVSDYAIGALEQLAGQGFLDGDRQLIESACNDKTRAQVDAAIGRIAQAYKAGNVKALGRYAASAIRNQPAVQDKVDHAERARIRRAEQLCRDLDVPWNDFHVDALRVVNENGTGVSRAVESTWRDYHGKLFTGASPAAWWDRFMSHLMETSSA